MTNAKSAAQDDEEESASSERYKRLEKLCKDPKLAERTLNACQRVREDIEKLRSANLSLTRHQHLLIDDIYECARFLP